MLLLQYFHQETASEEAERNNQCVAICLRFIQTRKIQLDINYPTESIGCSGDQLLGFTELK